MVQIRGGNDKQGFLTKQNVLTRGYVQLLLSREHSCHRPRRLEKESANLFRVALWIPVCVLSLVTVEKIGGAGRRIFLDSLILVCLIAWAPKEPKESQTTRMELEGLMLSKISRSEKDKYHMTSLT